MFFGLLTGCYEKSTSGGVLRQDVGTINNEINWNTAARSTATAGIIRTSTGSGLTGLQPRPAGGYGWRWVSYDAPVQRGSVADVG